MQLFSVLTAALAFAAAAQAVTVRLTEADGARVQLSIHPGDFVRIDLPAAPATGHQWAIQGRIPVELAELGHAQRVYGGRLSNQGVSSFAWRALTPGEGTLTLIYGGAASRAERPEKTFTLQIAVAGAPLGPEEAHPPAISALAGVATYRRTLPCGDCTALDEALSLYRAPQESPFVLRRLYRDAPGGTLTTVATGSWSSHAGAADPSAAIYELAGNAEASLFRAEGDLLVPLDAQQVPIPSPPGQDNRFHKLASPG